MQIFFLLHKLPPPRSSNKDEQIDYIQEGFQAIDPGNIDALVTDPVAHLGICLGAPC